MVLFSLSSNKVSARGALHLQIAIDRVRELTSTDLWPEYKHRIDQTIKQQQQPQQLRSVGLVCTIQVSTLLWLYT